MCIRRLPLAASALLALAFALNPPPAAAGIPVAGRVTTRDGAPLPGARAELLPVPDRHAWASLVLDGRFSPEPAVAAGTGDDGRFTLEAPEAGVWAVVVRAAGFVPMRFSPLPLAVRRVLPPVALMRDAGAQVRVLGRGGVPAAGVWVVAEAQGKDGQGAADGWRVATRAARTDGNGVVRLPRLADERLTVSAVPVASLSVQRRPCRESCTVMLAPADRAHRAIEVRDVDGEPVEGVVVAAGDLPWPVGVTGEAGRLVLSGKLAGPVDLHLVGAAGRRTMARLEPFAAQGDRTVQYTLPSASTLSGRILDAVNRHPLARALVWTSQDPGAFTFSDPRGTYHLAVSAEERAWVQAHADGHLPGSAWARGSGESPARISTLILHPAARARGVVVDGEGRPLSGVEIEAERVPAPRGARTFSRDRAAAGGVSDARGAFLLEGLDPRQVYEIGARRTGYVPVQKVLAPTDIGSAEGVVKVVLTRARSAFGRVVDAEARPIAGAEVTALPGEEKRSAADPAVTVHTDAEGRFELPAVPASRIALTVRREGFAPFTVRGIDLSSGDPAPFAVGTVVLVPGVTVEGVVTDPGGEPLPEAAVWLVDGAKRPTRRLAEQIRARDPACRTGPKGRFRIGDLDPGEPIHLLISRQGYRPSWEVRVKPSATGPLAILLHPAAVLEGRVEDQDGKPVPRASVRLRGRGPLPGTLGVKALQNTESRTAVSDPEGRFHFEELAPGDVELDAWKDGFRPAETAIISVRSAEQGEPVRLVLERGVTVEGWVSDSDGEPIADVEVAIERARAPSDGAGFFRLRGVAPGRRPLDLRHPEYRRYFRWLDVEPDGKPLEVVLKRGFPVTGVVTEEETGTPAEGAAVELARRSLGAGRHYRTVSGGDGRFRFGSVAPGSYDVLVHKSGFAPSAVEKGLTIRDEGVENLELFLRPGIEVSGRILGLDADELARVQVAALSAAGSSRSGSVDYRGRYEVRDLGPGDWLLRAALPGGERQAERRISLDEGTRKLTADLELGQGLSLSGRVTLDGEALAETEVSVDGYDVATNRSVWTDHEGRYRFEDLEAGRYRVNLSNHRQMLVHNQDIELNRDLDLPFDFRTARIAGRVVSAATARSLAEARVSLQRLQSAPGDRVGSIISLAADRDGGFVIAKLTAGRYRLTVSKDGYATKEERLQLEPGALREGMEISLDPTEGLDLVVHLPMPAGESLAALTVLGPAGEPVLRQTRRLPQDGVVRFPSVPPGQWEIHLFVPQCAPVQATVTVPGPPVEVSLAPGTRIAVRVADLAISNTVASLALVSADGRPFEGMDVTGTLRDHWTLPAGVGVVEGVPPGRWVLNVAAPDGRTWQKQVVTSGGAMRVDLE